MMRFSRHSGNPNIGVFAAVNESLAFTSADASPEFVRALEEALGVKTIKTTVAGAHVIGSLMAINSNCAVVSGLADSREVEVIEEHIPCFLLDDSLNAAGNNILVNDHGAIISPDYGHEMAKPLSDALGVEVVFSSEPPADRALVPSSLIMVPSEAGLLLAYRCIGKLAFGE